MFPAPPCQGDHQGAPWHPECIRSPLPMKKPLPTRLALAALCAALVSLSVPAGAAGPEGQDPTLWPEPQRAFFQDGPGLLLPAAERERLLAADPAERERLIEGFLNRDPLPETPGNELSEGIARRRSLAQREIASPQDVRAKLLFLNGAPTEREIIDCGSVFRPIEVWWYPGGAIDPATGKARETGVVVYKPNETDPWRLWQPIDSKRVLYTPLMEYWLEQWEELRGRIRAVRFDKQNCSQVEAVDRATGVPGLTGARPNPNAYQGKALDNSRFLDPPKDLARWARDAAATELPGETPPPLKLGEIELRFPRAEGQRLLTRAVVPLAEDSGAQPAPAEEGRQARVELVAEGMLENDGRPFEDFRMRFSLPAAGPLPPLALDRLLRPGETFVLRLKVTDPTTGAEARVARGFRVPLEPTGEDAPAGAVGGEPLPETVARGRDTLLLLPPTEDVVFGLWRAETIVTGDRIRRAVFLVDGQAQLTRTNPPFSAEVRLEKFPREQVVRVEGYDEHDELVAADEVVLNQPRGALGVWILEPAKGADLQGRVPARAEVSIPDERRIETVEFRVNDATVATLAKPPWEATIDVPPGEEIVYLTVVATLDDGARTEAVRTLRAPGYLEELEVNLVEMFVAVNDRSGALVRDLTAEDFEIVEDGRPQEIVQFELVDNLPLTVGILLDTSGSMATSLVETQKAAAGFLESVVSRRDRSFAISFARRPRLEMPPTEDVGAVVRALSGLQAVGDTALHDAIVHSLYYFRGLKGQRAMVLLSDGDDNASYIKFEDAMEYARRSGVAIYAIGLKLPGLLSGVQAKLRGLAEATGGRVFFTDKPEELPEIYAQIERELRSRYLLAYNSDRPTSGGAFREVEVRVKRRGLKARTARGYRP
jgi:Ca-activated chloride channel homolog